MNNRGLMGDFFYLVLVLFSFFFHLIKAFYDYKNNFKLKIQV